MKFLIHLGYGIVITVAILVISWFFPFNQINWGKMSLTPDKTITVVGTATNQVNNEIAKYSAGVQAVNDNKDAAVKEVAEKIDKLVASLKTFGIAAQDIKTQNLNIYQQQESFYEDGRQKQRLGQWNVGNTVEITLRDIARAKELTELLSSSGANNVYGPNFGLSDNTNNNDQQLTQKVLDNARAKAEAIAAASGVTLDKVLQVSENGQTGMIPFAARLESGGGGGGMPIETGSSTISKSLTVVYSIK